MAAIPTYYVIGDRHLNGPTGVALLPQPGSQGAFWTNANNYPLLMQTVPTTGTAFLPWWDGTAGTILASNAASNGATGYDVDNAGGYPSGTNSIVVHGGTGNIAIGDRIKFAGHATWYEVTTGVTAPSGTLVIAGAGLTSSVVDGSEITVAAQVTATTAPWTADSEVDKVVQIDAGVGLPVSGFAQTRTVVANTTDTLYVSAAWTTAPTASSFHVHDGQFVKYDHIRGADNPLSAAVTEGDNWYSNQSGGFGFTVSLMQLLKARHPTGFKVIKLANDVATAQWKSGGTAYTNLSAERTKAVADMAPDTEDVKGVFMWTSGKDIEGLATSYFLDLISAVADIRTLIGDTTNAVPFWAISHSSEYLQVSKTLTVGSVTSSFSFAIRQSHVAATASGGIANFQILDMEGKTWGADSAVAPSTISADPSSYSTQSHIELGERAFNAIVRYYAATPSTANDSLPCVIMLGDSQGVGFISPQYAINGQAESVLGPSGTVRSNQWIWNDVAQEWQLYDLTGNANTFGSAGSLTYGPESAMMKDLAVRFPDGVAVFKFAEGGCSMTTEGVAAGALVTLDPESGTKWSDVQTAWNAARLAALQDLGQNLDTVAAVYLLGDNDGRDATSSAAFATKLPTFNTSVREVFTTRTTGEDLDILTHIIPDHVDNGGQSVIGTGTATSAVRSAQTAQALADTHFHTISDAGLELIRDDDIHYTGRAQDTVGERFAASIIALIDGEAATAASGDVPSGAASFTVETGSGATDGNSYVAVADADSYHIHHGNPSAWANATVVQKQDWLRQATLAVDLEFGAGFPGWSTTGTQALLWPRYGATDKSNDMIASNVIPAALQDAVSMLALQLANGETILTQSEDSTDVASETKTVGAVSISKTYLGGRSPQTQFPAVRHILKLNGLLDGAGVGWGSSIL